jgi:hypothetical protein
MFIVAVIIVIVLLREMYAAFCDGFWAIGALLLCGALGIAHLAL